jgi:hypothetical protein
MDPSIYQQQPQQPQQPSRAPYPFSGNAQGSSTVMGAGAYSEQYMPNNAYGTGINQMMPISGRPVYPIASITGNSRATAKRALGSGAQVQSMFSNMGQASGQNQLYTTGFPNQQIVGRSTVPTQSFVNTDNQNMDGKSPAPIQQNAYASSIQNINKYYGQLQKSNSIGNNFNMLNQNHSQHSQQSNQAIHNSIQQEESQVDWLDLGDDEEVVYDFNCSPEFTNNSSGMGNNIQGWNSNSIQSNLNFGSQNTSKPYSINQNNIQQSPQQLQEDQQLQQQAIPEQQQQQERQSTPQPLSQQQHSQPSSLHITQPSQQQQQREDTSYAYSPIPSLPSNSVSQNLSPKNMQNSSLGMLPRSPNPSSDSSRQSSVYVNQNQGQTGSQLGQFTKMTPKDHLSTSSSLIVNYSQPTTQSSLSTEMSSNSSIQNAIVDHYNQPSQSTVESKSNSLMSHLRTATQEHQGESASILSNDNQNSFNASVQVTSANSRITSSTDIPKDISNIPFNTEMLNSVLHPMNNSNNGNGNNNNNNNQQQQPQPPNQVGNITQNTIVENATPNLRLPVNSGIAGRRNITSRQVSRQPDKTISVSSSSPLISSDQPSSTKPTHPKPPKVNYAPKTRRVDSYGGLDLRVFEKFSLPLTIPGIQDLGIYLIKIFNYNLFILLNFYLFIYFLKVQ